MLTSHTLWVLVYVLGFSCSVLLSWRRVLVSMRVKPEVWCCLSLKPCSCSLFSETANIKKALVSEGNIRYINPDSGLFLVCLVLPEETLVSDAEVMWDSTPGSNTKVCEVNVWAETHGAKPSLEDSLLSKTDTSVSEQIHELYSTIENNTLVTLQMKQSSQNLKLTLQRLLLAGELTVHMKYLRNSVK